MTWFMPWGIRSAARRIPDNARFAMAGRFMRRRALNLQFACAPWLLSVAADTRAAMPTQDDAARALRTALERGAHAAVNLLARTDGFLGNPKVRIALPGHLNDAAKWLAAIGQQKRVDELVTAMNRAAEAAVPKARTLLIAAVKGLNLQDAQRIVSGGENSATEFFAQKTREPLGREFLPIVTHATEKVSLTAKYNKVASKASSLGLLAPGEANLERYVTAKALDGLYLVIGEEERKIRQNPVATGSAILNKVFGSIKPKFHSHAASNPTLAS
jgi:hypothetical protein